MPPDENVVGVANAKDIGGGFGGGEVLVLPPPPHPDITNSKQTPTVTRARSFSCVFVPYS